eukprot:14681-Pelagococcus_subviridis.AAC.2
MGTPDDRHTVPIALTRSTPIPTVPPVSCSFFWFMRRRDCASDFCAASFSSAARAFSARATCSGDG